MRTHPVIGERILRRTPELEEIAPLVRHEHERWDGGGYPTGWPGPLDADGRLRIISACDAYNAMITRRPYHGEHERARRRGRTACGSRRAVRPWCVDAPAAGAGGLGGRGGTQAMAGRPA